MKNIDTNDRNIFAVFGARRSGTNYLEQLLLHNFSLSVANLNRTKALRLPHADRRPWLFEKIGSKHNLNDINNKFSIEYYNLAIIRNPISWLDARIRYHLLYNSSVNRHSIHTKDIGIWIENEYNTFYNKIIECNIPLYIYEMILENPKLVINDISNRIGVKSNLHFLEPNNLIAPNGGLLGNRPNDFIEVKKNILINPPDDVKNHIHLFDKKLIALF